MITHAGSPAGTLRVALTPTGAATSAPAVYGGFLAAGVLLIAALVVAAGHEASATLSGTHVTVGAAVAVAGEATTLTARVGTTGGLQPWLGMLGHLIVVGPLPAGGDVSAAAQQAPIWAHAHSMGNRRAWPAWPG